MAARIITMHSTNARKFLKQFFHETYMSKIDFTVFNILSMTFWCKSNLLQVLRLSCFAFCENGVKWFHANLGDCLDIKRFGM